MNHFIVDKRSVFVSHRPGDEKPHRISILDSGNFEVVCTHKFYDEGNIKCQIKRIMTQQLLEKKNN